MHVFSKIVLFQKVLFLSTFCFLFLGITAQDSLYKIKHHVIGIGPQFLREPYNNYGHDKNYITYNKPAYTAFYRLFFNYNKKYSSTSANIYFTYRKAFGYSQSGGMGGSSSYEGIFELCRFDIGLSRFVAFGRRRGFNLGGGFGLGGLIYSNGEIKEYSYSQGNSVSASVSLRNLDLLNKVNAYMNFELSQRFKVFEKSFIMVGSKFQLESPEGFNARIGLTETMFVAYVFK